MLKIFAVTVIMFAIACTSESESSSMTAIGGDSQSSFYCNGTQIPHFEPDGSYTCQDPYAWPPIQTGSRSVSSNCSISNGQYHINWDDSDRTIVPAFSISDVVEFKDDIATLTRDGVDPSSYKLQWESEGYVELYDNSGRIVNFTIHCNADGTIAGDYTLDVAWVDSTAQIQKWSFIGTQI